MTTSLFAALVVHAATLSAPTTSTSPTVGVETTAHNLGNRAPAQMSLASFSVPATAPASERTPAAAAGSGFTVQVPSLNIDAAAAPVGSSGGTMTIPTDVSKLGWYKSSSQVQDMVGSIIVAGHVATNSGKPGAFSELRKVSVGDKIKTVQGSEVITWVVTSQATYSRDKALPSALFDHKGPVELRLVTCTNKITYPDGSFHYRDNLVVSATRA